MRDRTAAVIITILAILFCGCPGLAFLLLGGVDLLDYYGFNSYIFGSSDQTAVNIWSSVFLCTGILFIIIAVVVSVLVLRRRNEPLSTPKEPLPPPV